MADWTSTVTTWQQERMRSTARARLAMCHTAHPGPVDEWGSPSPGRIFTNIGHPGEQILPAADNTRVFADVQRNAYAGSRLSRGAIPR